MDLVTSPALLVLAVTAGMVAVMASERVKPDAAVLGGVALLLATGLLPTAELLAALSNPAPITVAAMFVLSGALTRTGAVEALGDVVARMARRRPTLALAVVIVAVAALSAFMNNTPVVVVLIPVMMKLAVRLGRPASRLLIPLSYAAILGGTCTLVGTSTNLLVDGVARAQGLEPFGMFETSPLGVAVTVAGLLYLALVGHRMLPDRHTVTSTLGGDARPRFLVEVVVPEGSPLVGTPLAGAGVFTRRDRRLVDVLRGDESLRRELDGVVLRAGDRLVIKTPAHEVMSLREETAVAFADPHAVEPVASRETVVVEGLVGPGSPMLDKTLRHLRLRRRYGVYPLAMHRQGANVGDRLEATPLRVGDTLLLEGTPADVRRLSEEQGVVNLAEPAERPFRRSKAPIVALSMVAVVGLAALGVLPIVALAVVAVAVVIITRCIDADEAYRSIDWRILVVILGMLAVSRALETSGAMALVVGGLLTTVEGLPPIAVLAAVYVLASLMTELVSNSAVAVLVTPVAIGIAQQLGVDPRPFVVAVMFAASASFATPIGYQTNTLVYSAGGYRFSDFLRVGVPMNVLVGLITVPMIPLLWPFR